MSIQKSVIKEVSWPPIPEPRSAVIISVVNELEKAQWWTLEDIRAQQFRQLQSVLMHAYETVPFYRKRLDDLGFNPKEAQITPDFWQGIPLLSRQEIQENSLLSSQVPVEHGKTFELRTSGSTGQPVIVNGTALTSFFWRVFTVREHLWSKRDLSGKLAAIRSTKGKNIPLEGKTFQSWGSPTDSIYRTGQSAMLPISTDISKQLQWLQQQNPDFLITYPSNLAALATRSHDLGIDLPNLCQVRTFGGMISDDLRKQCKDVWNANLVDMYSSNEFGYIALQCPEQEHYHIQAENVFVEILDDDGQQCKPGETGKIVISSLHNFATPLIRYDIRDYAEVGYPCPCGRGLPVLSRIVGRERNMLVMPSGEKRWPQFKSYEYAQIAPISQFQYIQKSLEEIEVRLVPKRKITQDEERELSKAIRGHLGGDFTMVFRYFKNEIPQGANGKIEEFTSCVL